MLNRLLSLITFGCSKTHAFTIGGWTPGVRRLVAGRALPCGCLAGVYHTLSDEEAEIIDASAPACPHQHDMHLILRRRRLHDRAPILDLEPHDEAVVRQFHQPGSGSDSWPAPEGHDDIHSDSCVYRRDAAGDTKARL